MVFNVNAVVLFKVRSDQKCLTAILKQFKDFIIEQNSESEYITNFRLKSTILVLT